MDTAEPGEGACVTEKVREDTQMFWFTMEIHRGATVCFTASIFSNILTKMNNVFTQFKGFLGLFPQMPAAGIKCKFIWRISACTYNYLFKTFFKKHPYIHNSFGLLLLSQSMVKAQWLHLTTSGEVVAHPIFLISKKRGDTSLAMLETTPCTKERADSGPPLSSYLYRSKRRKQHTGSIS